MSSTERRARPASEIPGRKPRSWLRNRCEFVLARTIIEVARHLPPELLAPLSRALGRLLTAIISGRRRAVRENVAIAYGEGKGPDSDHLCRESIANLCQGFLELAKMPRSPEELGRLVADEAVKERLADLQKDGGFVCFSAHLGAYEVGGMAVGLLGLPVTTLSRPLDNHYLEDWVSSIRMRFGQELVTNRGGMREFLRQLRAGRTVVIMGDINHRPKNRIFVDYFGTPAATAPALGVLARRTQRPLVGLFLWRTETPMRFEWEISEAIWPDPSVPKDEDVHRLVSEMTKQIETRVRRRPEQWLWTHRRWKTRPAEENS